jgi:hypothetical protein
LQEYIDDNYCSVFIDDILIYSTDDEEHARHVQAVLNTNCKAGIRLQEAKCMFQRTKMQFLEFEIIGEYHTIQATHRIVNPITDWPN